MQALQSKVLAAAEALASLAEQLGEDGRLETVAAALEAATVALREQGAERDELLDALWDATSARKG